MANGKYYSGEKCLKTGTYGQYHDTDNSYYGVKGDREVAEGKTFPPSENNYYWKMKR